MTTVREVGERLLDEAGSTVNIPWVDIVDTVTDMTAFGDEEFDRIEAFAQKVDHWLIENGV